MIDRRRAMPWPGYQRHHRIRVATNATREPCIECGIPCNLDPANGRRHLCSTVCKNAYTAKHPRVKR